MPLEYKLTLLRLSLKDDDLASRLGLQTKELNKLMAYLIDHKLVEVCV
jgi:transcription initiation factor IIE alpha subunit